MSEQSNNEIYAQVVSSNGAVLAELSQPRSEATKQMTKLCQAIYAPEEQEEVHE